MAELTTEPTPTSSCCSPAAQETCCEPSEKGACCGTAAAGGECGCSAGKTVEPETDIREQVRERYAAAARAAAEGGSSSCGCGPASLTDEREQVVFGGSLYDDGETDGATSTAVEASLGCGVPTAV